MALNVTQLPVLASFTDNLPRSNDNFLSGCGRRPLLVQSVRGADGKPTHKVIANLGDLEPLLIENLRIALAAARQGKSVVIAESTGLPEQNLPK
jgi:hypothetical protein